MTNQLAALPWVLDTPSASALYLSKMHVHHMEYVDYTDPTAVCEVQDQNGHIVALLHGTTDLGNVGNWMKVGWIDGLLIPLTLTNGGADNLPSGKLLIYLK